MLRRLLLAVSLSTAALLLVAHRQLRSPVPSTTALLSSEPPSLAAVADLHGDLPAAIASLRLVGLVDAAGAWAGGTAHLVQTGDLEDRGADSVGLLRFFWRLQEEARAAGGDVTLLAGNHLLWALSGYHEFVAPEELRRVGGAAAWDALFSAHGEVGGRVAAGHVAVAVAGEGRCATLFAHAGLSASLAEAARQQALAAGASAAEAPAATLGVINARFAAALAAAHGPNLEAADPALLGSRGPFWERSFAMSRNEAAVCADVRRTLAAVGAQRMVVGHTVQRQARARCNGALVLLDTGISGAYNGVPAAFGCSAADGAYAITAAGRRSLDAAGGF